MNIHFLSFGTTWNYSGALQRVANQVTSWRNTQDQNIFKSIAICNEQILLTQFPDFVKTHLNFFQTQPRGFGYWLWKSFLIKQSLKVIPNNDVLFYMDIGCQLNIAAEDRFNEYCTITQESGLLCFKVGMPEYQWCKADTASFIVDKDTNIMNNSQIIATTHMIKNTPLNFDLVTEWYETCYHENYRYLDDSASVAANHPDFKEHRHDQAIFSLLVKKYNQYTALDDETWKPNWHVDGIKSPIWATRNHKSSLI
jgi:hypothetical protein